MTEVIKYFCDICGAECLPREGMGTFMGAIAKMNDKLERQQLGFNGHYCSKDTEMLLEFIAHLKQEYVNNQAGSPDQRTEQPNQGDTGSK